MRHAVALVALCTSCTGCALVDDAGRNFLLALKTPIEQHREMTRNREWAEAAWSAEYSREHESEPSVDFADGFKQGFADYLYRGGDGEPPLVAPLRYRKVSYQTPEGYQAIQDWFAGYRRGTAVARDSGARKFVTGPSSLQPDSHIPGVSPKSEPPIEVLPAPLPLPKPADETPAAIPRAEFGPPIDLIQPEIAPERAPIERPPSLPSVEWPKPPKPDSDPAPTLPVPPILPPTFDPPAPQPLGFGVPKTVGVPQKD